MISTEQVDVIVSRVEQAGLGEAVLAELRTEYPDVRFTYCMDDDIGAMAKPVVERTEFNLYFVDSREHCLCLTNDHAIATGVVLAEVIPDDDE
jgi:hypothetical protein